MGTDSDLNPIHFLALILVIARNEKYRGHVADLPISPPKMTVVVYGLV